MPDPTASNAPWWQTAVIYQIYPRSFQDSNGDGVGDLPGILARLDYLVELGVDALWISPFYPSPMADFGYDVADYTGVDPIFGTLADFDRLLAAAHDRKLKLIVDFVPNHSSDRHPWFLESRRSRTDPKRDWYIWRDASADGGPPNNWLSHFGGSAWTLDPATGQFYLHSFLKEQPDLNWREPELKAAIFDAMRFWLDRGVDGFRMDVLWLLIKDDQFRSNPKNPDWKPGSGTYGSLLPVYTEDRPETHRIVAEMRALLDGYSADGSERLLIGEIYLPLAKLVTYYGAGANGDDGREADLPFNFRLILTAWDAEKIACLIREYEALLPPGAWPNYVLGNHDQPRLATRIGAEQARVAAMLLLTLRGTPTIYYGDELGMQNVAIPFDEIQDPAEKNQPGIGLGRDPERTPMLWDGSRNAGFTDAARPWLPISPNVGEINVEVERTQPRSQLNLYRKLLQLRRAHPALRSGAIGEVAAENGVLSYRRRSGDETILILLNLTDEIRTVLVPASRVLLTTILDGNGAEAEGGFTMEAAEGVVLILNSAEL